MSAVGAPPGSEPVEAADDDELAGVPDVGSMRRAVWARLRPQRARLLVAIAVLVVSTAATLAGPLIVGYAIDHALGAHGLGELTVLSAIFLFAAVVALVTNRIQIQMVGALGERFLYRLRLEVFDHLQRLSLGFYDAERTGRLVARMTSDFDAMESLVQQGLIVLVTNGLMFVTAMVILLVLSWQLFLICLLVVPVLYFPSRKFNRDSKVAYLQVRERVGQTMITVEEGITGVKVVQAYGREEHQVHRFAHRNAAQLEANLDAVRVSIRYFPVIEGSSVITVAAMLGIGGLFVEHNIVMLGTVVSFVLYLNSLFDPLQQMSNLFNQVQQSGAALRKLLGILAVTPELVEDPSPVELPGGGELVVRSVAFAVLGERPRGAARRRPHAAAGGAAGPRRPDRRRQVHPGQAHRPPVRPNRGIGHLRRRRPARGQLHLAPPPHRDGAPGGLLVPRVAPRQRAARPARGHRCRGDGGARGRRRARAVRGDPGGTRPAPWRGAARRCRPASASSSRWPGQRSPHRTCSCSTRRPRASTRGRRPPSRPPWTRSPRAARRW